MAIRIFGDPGCLEHRAPFDFPESPERVEAILQRFPEAEVEPRAAGSDARAAVARVHSDEYLQRFRRAVQRGDGLLDSADNPLSPATWDAAWAAVTATLRAVDWASEAEGRVAFAAVRPPGHHAERAMAMGFCYLNNVAVAAEHLLARHGVERVAIVDFDVHHGNGTQHIFERRAEVFFASVHRSPFYPGTGAAEERGLGKGDGATCNVPLPLASDDLDYRRAFDQQLLPAVREFAPQALLVSAGFDAWQRDPLGGMRVTARGYAEWGNRLGKLAAEQCGGRVVSVLEGGYDLEALPDLVEAYLDGVAAGLG